jgi:hypothetical protein
VPLRRSAGFKVFFWGQVGLFEFGFGFLYGRIEGKFAVRKIDGVLSNVVVFLVDDLSVVIPNCFGEYASLSINDSFLFYLIWRRMLLILWPRVQVRSWGKPL